jgi:hypothetical protein
LLRGLRLEGHEPPLDEHSDHLRLRQGQPRELPPSALLLAAGQGSSRQARAVEDGVRRGNIPSRVCQGTRRERPRIENGDSHNLKESVHERYQTHPRIFTARRNQTILGP